MKKHKSEIIGVTIIVCATIFLMNRCKSEEARLKHEGVFVIGRLFNSSFGADNGWVSEYEYYYGNKKYVRSFNWPSNVGPRDSILFFNILPTQPEVCRQIIKNRVPECFRRINLENKFWTEIPSCK